MVKCAYSTVFHLSLILDTPMVNLAMTSQQTYFCRDTDEICLEGDQCKSGCCQKHGTLNINRCSPLSSDNHPCQKDVSGVYF
uniref:Colipase N-terminal domain-containing protein n=1 Tax=Eptatretus burgeri TaxID=7764 RepID=A0A8C4QVB7_EPTBU